MFGKIGIGSRFGLRGGATLRRAKGGPAAPSAPVLSLNSEVAGLISVLWDVDNTVAAGDMLSRQVATDSGFATIVGSTSHTISSGEDAANQIAASQYQAPANGTYYIRGSVTSATTGKTSGWSNVLTVVVADMSSDPTDYVDLEVSGGYIESEAGGGYIQQEAA